MCKCCPGILLGIYISLLGSIISIISSWDVMIIGCISFYFLMSMLSLEVFPTPLLFSFFCFFSLVLPRLLFSGFPFMDDAHL